jgi:hypothetical protein
MTDTDKFLKTSPSPRLLRAKQMLENQKTALTLLASLNEDSPKQTNVVKGETGGPKGPDPTRYGDWERNGRCIDF